MKKFLLRYLFLLHLVLSPFAAVSQGTSDEHLKGVWVYTSYSVGDKMFGKDFYSIKVYGENGEYCSAQLQKLKMGTYKIIPHDYGTYVYRDGCYTECGRKGNLNLLSPTKFNGEWMGRIEYWEKVVDFPSQLREYIVSECRKAVLGDDEELQQLIEHYWIERSERRL